MENNDQMKKVLIITYYWPPSAGVGVQRWLKFSKYLPLFGWEPIIFTPENPDFNIKDVSLDKNISQNLEIIKFPIWEPFQLFNKITGGKNKDNIKQGLVLEKNEVGLKDKASIWVRGNLLIPDPRRFWISPSIKFLKNFIHDRGIQYVITTGPPHSMHLIGLGLKKKLDIKWIADFRDPWSQWDLLDKLKAGQFAKYYHKVLENKVLKNADEVITVSKNLAESLGSLAARNIKVITNGIDPEDFTSEEIEAGPPAKFRISHFGLLNEMRNPETLWRVLHELCDEQPDFAQNLEINLAGIVSESILKFIEKDPVLGPALVYHAYLNHQEVIKQSKESVLLLLLLNNTENAKWIIPGKLFEYLAVGKPILMLGPEKSDAGDIITTLNAGVIADFDDKKKIKKHIQLQYQNYQEGKIQTKTYDLEPYSRKKLTGDLADLMDNL